MLARVTRSTCLFAYSVAIDRHRLQLRDDNILFYGWRKILFNNLSPGLRLLAWPFLGCRPFWPGPPRYAIYWLACPLSFRPRLSHCEKSFFETRRGNPLDYSKENSKLAELPLLLAPSYCFWKPTRKPRALLRLLGSLLRLAERRCVPSSLQEPPRRTRSEPVVGPVGSV